MSTLERLGQVQTEEGLPEDAVKTYLQVLELQGDDDPQEVAKARYQASTYGTVQRLVKMERKRNGSGETQQWEWRLPAYWQSRFGKQANSWLVNRCGLLSWRVACGVWCVCCTVHPLEQAKKGVAMVSL